MDTQQMIQEYVADVGPFAALLAGLSDAQLDATPIAGAWSIRQVVCHLADFEIIYADRMKRVIVEQEPTFFGGDPDQFAARLAYPQRDCDEELQVIAAVRSQVARILRTLDAGDFQRIGNHNEAGPLTLANLLQRCVGHLQHHQRFIEQKISALGASS